MPSLKASSAGAYRMDTCESAGGSSKGGGAEDSYPNFMAEEKIAAKAGGQSSSDDEEFAGLLADDVKRSSTALQPHSLTIPAEAFWAQAEAMVAAGQPPPSPSVPATTTLLQRFQELRQKGGRRGTPASIANEELAKVEETCQVAFRASWDCCLGK